MSDLSWTNVTVKLSDLLPWTGNPKTSTGKNAKQLQDSRDELGQFQTVAIEPTGKAGVYQVADGHQRLSAWLAKYGKAAEIDARLASRPLTETERRKIAIYSRQIGAWDWDVLSGWEPEELTGWGFDVDLLQDWRRDVAALGNFLESEEEQAQGDAEPQTNRAEELRAEWGVELGQMWRLPSRTEGQEHRLICGDCTDEAVVDRVMGGDVADMVFTDPPYNVAYQDNESLESLKKRNRRQDGLIVENDSKTDEEFMLFLVSVFSSFPLKDGGAYYVCAPPGRTETQFRNALDSVGKMELRECIVWVKDVFVFGRQDYHWRHESILYGWREGAAHYFIDDRTQDTVWEITRPKESELHPTMKPVELVEKGIRNSSNTGENVYEPFSGSGTTIIAAENLSRQCRAVEISPAYVAVALQRYLDAFGIRAELVE